MAYIASDLYLDDMKELLDENWVEYEDTPKPELIITNDPLESPVRYDLNNGDAIIIRPDSEQVRYRGNITYYDRIVSISLDMLTNKDRQRLHDMWKMVRIICFAQKHAFPTYQLIKMISYTEMVEEQLNIWRGVARIQLENHAIAVDT